MWQFVYFCIRRGCFKKIQCIRRGGFKKIRCKNFLTERVVKTGVRLNCGNLYISALDEGVLKKFSALDEGVLKKFSVKIFYRVGVKKRECDGRSGIRVVCL